ncbi:GNAT family N-acetyltransferase [Shimia biformata]|uniref:GNAT family N-acetyltransferase n=1 Tax=Shimia biformata TaxID=1294299 RepID=UPI0019524246|nr:GNAT family N-acetyltransferase [Shimia biformata]
MDKTIDLRPFRAEDLPWLVARHRDLYAVSDGFDETFGDLVQTILEDFLHDHDPDVEQGWIAWAGDERLGSIFCVRLDETTAKLRLFLVVPEARGTGLGKRLLTTCMSFARTKGYRRMELWTHESHAAACALYRRAGWRCVSSKPVRSFGVDLVEQSWKIAL